MSQKETTDNPTVEHAARRPQVDLQKLHRRRMVLFGLVILGAGIVIGAASTLILAPDEVMPPPRPVEMITIGLLARMERELHLSPEQKDELASIIKTHTKKIGEIYQESGTQTAEHWRQMNEEIAAALTPEQREEWERWSEDVQRRFRGGPRRGGPWWGSGGPGPGHRRGPGDPNRLRKGPGPFGPGRRPEDPNSPRTGPGPFGPGRRPEDPNRPRTGPGPFGPGRRPEDPNRPRNGFDYDRFRRGPGPFDPQRPPAGPNFPRRGFGPAPLRPDEEPVNQDL